jgi:hypothetical protein
MVRFMCAYYCFLHWEIVMHAWNLDLKICGASYKNEWDERREEIHIFSIRASDDCLRSMCVLQLDII